MKATSLILAVFSAIAISSCCCQADPMPKLSPMPKYTEVPLLSEPIVILPMKGQK